MTWTGRYAQAMTALTIATYGDRCHLCLERGATTADHLVPRSKGGSDAIENLRPAHGLCNSQRGDHSIGWWRRRHAPHLLKGLGHVDNVANFLAETAGFSAGGPGNPRAASSALFPVKQKNAGDDVTIEPETAAFFALDRSGS